MLKKNLRVRVQKISYIEIKYKQTKIVWCKNEVYLKKIYIKIYNIMCQKAGSVALTVIQSHSALLQGF